MSSTSASLSINSVETVKPDPKNSVAVNTSTNPVKLNPESTKAKNLSDNKVIPPDTLDVTAWRAVGSAIESYSIWGDYSTGKNIGVLKSTKKNIEGFGGFMLSTMPDEYNGLSDALKSYLGKRVRLTGYIKTENVAEWSGLWLRVGKRRRRSPCFR
ncbi:MAG: hypothetical protein IPJ32_02340 [Sphingobacteriaceae bacterium]|nr:hypothetical protein [Sphingobacteriaceae bacterium]